MKKEMKQTLIGLWLVLVFLSGWVSNGFAAGTFDDIGGTATATQYIKVNDSAGKMTSIGIGTDANDLIQLDGTSKLPAVDGSQLTNLPSGGTSGFTTFDTVASMVVDASLSVGDDVQTMGYYAVGDGGGNTYKIVAAATGTADGGTYIDLVTHQAQGIFVKNIRSIAQYGAKSDGMASDHVATQAVADISTTGDQIIIPDNTYYDTKVTIDGGIDVITTGLVIDGTVNEALFEIGSFTTMDTSGAEYDFRIKRETSSDYSSLADTAVRFINISQAQIDMKFLQGHTVGFIMEGNTSISATSLGATWNHVRVGIATDCLVVVDQRTISGGGGTPFSNQNEFFFYGAYTNRNAVATNLTTDPAFVDGTDITTYIIRGDNVNGNSYYNPAIEMSWLSGGGQQFVGTGALLDASRNNKIYDARFEDALGAVAKLTGDSRENSFSVLYTDASFNPSLIDESIRQSNYLSSQLDIGEEQSRGVWDSGDLAQSATQGASASFPKLLNAGFIDKATTVDPEPVSAYSAHYITPKYVEIISGTRGFGVRLDTSRAKSFVVRREVVNDFWGRLGFSAREADGTQITTGTPVTSPLGVLALSAGASFIEWKISVDVPGDYVFKVASNVDHVVIFFAGGTNPLKIRRFQIHSLEGGTPAVTPGFISGNSGQRMSEILPTLGQYEAGETIFNLDPASTEAAFWPTSVAGFAANIVYQPSVGVSQGNYRYIAGSPDQVYYCQQTGTTGASSAPTPAGGDGQVDGTAIWDYAGPRAAHIAGPTIP